MRNPKWNRDEIILALDLYFTLEPGKIHSRNPKIIALSETLNKLPSFIDKPDAARFRNANGTSMKLSNFLAIDQTYSGQGMASFSKLDKEVFDEFKNDIPSLSKIAGNIKSIINDPNLSKELNTLSEENDVDKVSAKEGQILYKLHKYRERNHSLVHKKKAYHLKKHSNLACELCGFDFEKTYGEVGKGFIECHHKSPLYTLAVDTITKLEDLILVCSNCHRMEHRKLNL
ncbi:MAG: HNH endonuclease [Pedobacter sp.]|nr:MAG: HNH endonuclease [Pedobacter sp.]